jgi:hypothetical protein
MLMLLLTSELNLTSLAYSSIVTAGIITGGPIGGRMTTRQRQLISNSWPASFGLRNMTRCNWRTATSTRQIIHALAASHGREDLYFFVRKMSVAPTLQSQRNKRKLVDADSYVYVLNNSIKDATIQYWTYDRKTCCHAKVHVSNGRIVRHVIEHTHGPNVDEVTARTIFNEMVHYTKYHSTYNQFGSL